MPCLQAPPPEVSRAEFTLQIVSCTFSDSGLASRNFKLRWCYSQKVCQRLLVLIYKSATRVCAVATAGKTRTGWCPNGERGVSCKPCDMLRNGMRLRASCYVLASCEEAKRAEIDTPKPLLQCSAWCNAQQTFVLALKGSEAPVKLNPTCQKVMSAELSCGIVIPNEQCR